MTDTLQAISELLGVETGACIMPDGQPASLQQLSNKFGTALYFDGIIALSQVLMSMEH